MRLFQLVALPSQEIFSKNTGFFPEAMSRMQMEYGRAVSSLFLQTIHTWVGSNQPRVNGFHPLAGSTKGFGGSSRRMS